MFLIQKLESFSKTIPGLRGPDEAHVRFKIGTWLNDALRAPGLRNSFAREIWNGEGTEESRAPFIEESGLWTLPGSRTRSTTYSLLDTCSQDDKKIKGQDTLSSLSNAALVHPSTENYSKVLHAEAVTRMHVIGCYLN